MVVDVGKKSKSIVSDLQASVWRKRSKTSFPKGASLHHTHKKGKSGGNIHPEVILDLTTYTAVLYLYMYSRKITPNIHSRLLPFLEQDMKFYTNIIIYFTGPPSSCRKVTCGAPRKIK